MKKQLEATKKRPTCDLFQVGLGRDHYLHLAVGHSSTRPGRGAHLLTGWPSGRLWPRSRPTLTPTVTGVPWTPDVSLA